MITPSPSELTDRLIAGFDGRAEVRLDRALIGLLRGLGLERFKSEEIAWKVEDAVLRRLRERPPEGLPFRLCDGGKRLVGKARTCAADTSEIVFARNAEALASDLLDTLLGILPATSRLFPPQA